MVMRAQTFWWVSMTRRHPTISAARQTGQPLVVS